MILHIRSVFANLHNSLNYIRTVSTHTMEYIDTATSGTLFPHVLPVIDLQKMLQHIADTVPPTLHLPISPEITLHFYRYLCTHILIENKQFLLLIDVPIQDRSCQIIIHQILTLYMGITQPTMMCTPNTLESPRMQQWQWNSPLHNFRHVNMSMDSSASFPHPLSH